MIEALFEQKCPTGEDPIISIYSLENDSHEILLKVSNRFNIHLSQYAHKINFIHVKGREYLTPKPKLTMLCHIFLPMIYCLQCLWKHQPDVFYDTTGKLLYMQDSLSILYWLNSCFLIHNVEPMFTIHLLAKIWQQKYGKEEQIITMMLQSASLPGKQK